MSAQTNTTLHAEAPRQTTEAELEALFAAAHGAAAPWADTPADDRARVLEQVAAGFDEAVGELAAVADRETALGHARLRGEVARTSAQLRMFAAVIRDGAYLDVIISEADPATGRPDVRRMLTPLGPVAVFSASNFPFAFSVAGGDTASALAAGCPVIVKAHEGHPLTSRATTQVVLEALRRAGAPEGLLQTVYGQDAGRRLVAAPAIRAVGFTGSLRGGQALMAITQARPDPIPFYGELGSINPVLVLPGAARERGAEIAAGYVQSLTLGVGQFCTKPGLLFVPGEPSLLEEIAKAVGGATGGTMLTERIYDGYVGATGGPEWCRLAQVGQGIAAGERLVGRPEVRHVPLAAFLADQQTLTEERFGPAGLVVSYERVEQLLPVLPTLPGSLTATVHAAELELELARAAGAALRTGAGRLIFNGWPTGVAVCWAMHHGGPWPASSAPWSTSVGATAIRRWLQPIAYQGWPDEALPEALRTANPLGIARVVQPAGA